MNDTGTPVGVQAPGGGALSGVTSISAGEDFTCATTAGGDALCWGENDYGMLGNGSVTTDSMSPTQVVGLTSGVTQIAPGTDHACALIPSNSSGMVQCWGTDVSGELGNGTTSAIVDAPVGALGF
jgi:alpha-tubulin suppressor-like RCC1 family protein